MMETPQGSSTVEVLEFMKVWAASASEVMGQISGAAFPVEIGLEPFAEEHRTRDSELHLTVVTGGALHGEMNFCLPRAICLELAATFTGAAVQAELTAETQEAVLELFRQIGGQAAAGLKTRWDEVQITAQWGSAPSWTVAAAAFLRAGTGESAKFLGELQVSSALAAELRAKLPPTAPAEPAAEVEFSPRLDRLMDVELEVTLRFGGKRMLLRDILDLGPGAVIELDRRVQEPIDLLLDGRLLARGEVVVVDGNYGLRVTEVMADH
jgi:flagellar motor switch protein FliN